MLAGLVMLIGCHNPAAERRIAMRERQIRATAEMLAQHERLPEAQQRLQRTADLIRRDFERDGEEFRRDMRALRAWFEYDCNRWSEQQESYRRRLEQIFGGKPEDIEPTAIIMLF